MKIFCYTDLQARAQNLFWHRDLGLLTEAFRALGHDAWLVVHPKFESASKIKNQKSQKNQPSGPLPPKSVILSGGKAINPIWSFSAFGPAQSTTPSAGPLFPPHPASLKGQTAMGCALLPAA